MDLMTREPEVSLQIPLEVRFYEDARSCVVIRYCVDVRCCVAGLTCLQSIFPGPTISLSLISSLR